MESAIDDDHAGGHGYAHLQHRHHGGGDTPCADVRREVVAVHVGEPAAALLFAREALDHPHAGDVLLQAGVDDGDGLPGSHEGAPGVALPNEHGNYQERHHRKGDQRHLRALVEHDAYHQEQAEEVRQDHDETCGEQLLQGGHVAGDAGHDPAHLVVVVEAEGELLEVVEHLRAKRKEHSMPDPAGVEELNVLRGPGDQHQGEKDNAGAIDASEISTVRVCWVSCVDKVADEERLKLARADVDRHGEESEKRAAPERPEVAKEPAHHPVVVN